MTTDYETERKRKKNYYDKNFSSPYKEIGISAKQVLDKTKIQSSAVKPTGGPYFFMMKKRASNGQGEFS